MRRGRLICAVMIVLANCTPSALASGYRMSSDEAITTLVMEQFLRWRPTVTTDDNQPSVEIYEDYARAVTPAWTYVIDISGNQILRPTSLSATLGPLLKRGNPTESSDNTNPIRHWKLNDESSRTSGPKTLADASGRNNSGTVYSNPVRIVGILGAALDFDGRDDYADFGNPADLPSGRSARTICAWARSDSTSPGWRWIVAYGTSGIGQAMSIGMNGKTLLATGYASDLSVDGFWETGVWHHICLTYDGTTARVYADGDLVASGPKNWSLVRSRLYIGRQVNNAPEFWNGAIDDVRIYNRMLTGEEIGKLVRLSDGSMAQAQARQMPQAIADRVVSDAKRFVQPLVGAMPWDTKTWVWREVLTKRESAGPIRFYPGRIMVRLANPDNTEFFQMLCDPTGDPIRIDTNRRDTRTSQISTLLRARVVGTDEATDQAASVSLGTFFDPDEPKFELSAYSWEGEPFLNPLVQFNPFWQDGVDAAVVGVDRYRQSRGYAFWCWYWWDMYGRVNGIRGNWDSPTESWDRSGAVVLHHHHLTDYMLEGGEADADSRYMEERFYDDLEECNAAVLSTHGGPINDSLQLRRGDHRGWFILGRPEYKLGRGALRHLFVEGCATMNCYKETYSQLLARDWVAAGFVQGLRSVSGNDGGLVGLDRYGWRFFGRYNKGDSILEAWASTLIDECLENAPATVAYGQTLEEAIQTLFDGRFSIESAEPAHSVGSVWVRWN